MNLPIFWTGKGLYHEATTKALAFGVFAQEQANRLCFGGYRYDKGRPVKAARYMTRMLLEVAAYVSTGNKEHLRNIANYAFLESEAPEHGNFHDDTKAASATRRHLKMSSTRGKQCKS